jgi:thioredoxin-dependent peroxiredoxin
MHVYHLNHTLAIMQTTSRPEVGQQAPDFTAANTEGRKIRLSDYRGKKVVLYFYPKDDTPGCTVESCGFRDSYQVIRDTGAEILGVSVDDVGSHGRFTEKYRLPFTLVADVDKKITESYGVVNEKSKMARRVTFLIDAQGKIFKVFDPVKPDIHAKEVLDALKA